MLSFFLIIAMNDRLGTALELIAFTAFMAAIFILVIGSLAFISGQCTRGAPILPAIFPCF